MRSKKAKEFIERGKIHKILMKELFYYTYDDVIQAVGLAEQEMMEKAVNTYKYVCSSIYKGEICIKKVGNGMNLCNCDCDKGKEFIKLLNQNE